MCVNVLSEITPASTQVTPIAPVLSGPALEQAGAGKEIPDFAKTLSGVVSEAFPSADSPTETIASATKPGSSIHWEFEVGADSISVKVPRWTSGTVIDSVATSTSKPVAQQGGKAKKNVEKSAAHSAEGLAVVVTPGKADTITAAVVIPTSVAGTAQADQPAPQEKSPGTPIEKKSAAVVTFIPQSSVPKSDTSGELQQPEEISFTHETTTEFTLPVASADMPAGTKSDSRIDRPSVQLRSKPILSEPAEAMTATVPVAAEANDALTTQATKGAIEMRSQEHFDSPVKKTRALSPGGESGSFLRMPEAPLATAGTQIESAPLKGATAPAAVDSHAKAASSDPFTIMDAAPAEPAPQLLHSSRHEVEVGINDPTYGWVEVKTHKYAGEITATLSASSTESHRDLGTQLTGLTDYLSTRDIPINKVVMERMDTPNFGGQQSRHSASDGQGQGSAEGAATGFVAAPSQPEEVNEAQPGRYRYSSQIHLLA